MHNLMGEFLKKNSNSITNYQLSITNGYNLMQIFDINKTLKGFDYDNPTQNVSKRQTKPNKIFSFLLGLLFMNISFNIFAQNKDVNNNNFKLSFFEANIGLDTRYGYVNNTVRADNDSIYKTPKFTLAENRAFGISGMIKSSLLANFILNQDNKKWRFGDILWAGLSAGILQNNYDINNNPLKNNKNSIWFAYNFGLGFALTRQFSPKKELGINLTILKFIVDDVAENFSGSGLGVRYRYHHFVGEIGTEARREVFGGWFLPTTIQPRQFYVKGNILLKNQKTIGFQAEIAQNTYKDIVFNNDFQSNIWSAQLFYGIYF